MPATRHKYPTRANIQLRMDALEQANHELHEEIFTLRAIQERQAALIDTLMARLELIHSTALSTTVSSPVVSDTIPTIIPITTVFTADTTTGFGMSFGFAYSFGHPYVPHGFQGFIPPSELTQGFSTGPFGPYGPYGP